MRIGLALLTVFSLLLSGGAGWAQEQSPAAGTAEAKGQLSQDQVEQQWSLLSSFSYAANRLNSVVGVCQTRFDHPRTDRKYDMWAAFRSSERPLYGLTGTCFLFKKENGHYYFLTSSALLDNLNEEMEYPIKVTMADGKSYPAKKVGEDSTFKIAVIEVMLPPDYPVPDDFIGSSKELRVGQPVGILGYRIDEDIGIFAHGGIISSIRKRYPLAEERTDPYIQFDAPFNFGMIGGPLVTTDGYIVGVVRSPVSVTGFQVGINLAAPIDDVIPVAERIIAGEVRTPYIGWEVILVNDRIRIARNLPETINRGLLITYVEPGSPADIGGLKEGDVILTINDERIGSDYDYRNFKRKVQIGQTLRISYYDPTEQRMKETVVIVVEKKSEEEEGEEEGGSSGLPPGHP